MKEYTKIGFIYVAAGIVSFTILILLIGLIGSYEDSTGIAIAMAIMSAVMMGACKKAYIAGKHSALSS